MAAGPIITVLANIPWGQVLDNAPKVANGAMKLWNAVRNRKKPPPAEEEPPAPATDQNMSEADVLRARLRRLEENIASLDEQMQASTELIKALAEQNTQLVQRIELNRVRLVRLALASSVVAVVLLGVAIYT